ncbi:MAG TPA: gamma-glutamylcyclotransferase family protein [Longimicrobiales bacterium]
MADGDAARRGAVFFNLFTYGTLRRGGSASALLEGCTLVGVGTVAGTLYDIDGAYPAMVLAGTDRVEGEVWACPTSSLARFDAYEGVADGLFRRVGVRVGDWTCWTYVAGPKLARRLTARNRVRSGRWMQNG